MLKRNQCILLMEKTEHDIIEREMALSDRNSKTVDMNRFFKEYKRTKNVLNNELHYFYMLVVH